MKKTVYYSSAVVVLLIINLALFFGGNSKKQVNQKSFLEQDALTQLNQVSFTYKDQQVDITNKEGKWMVNDEYPVDQGFFNTLVSVLERVEVRREVKEVSGQIDGNVLIRSEGGDETEFSFATNAAKTKSYFIANGITSEVIVPGYRDNVADIFSLHPDQWRDRLIIDGNWRSIQNVKVNISNTSSLEIQFVDKFFLVNGQQPRDSSLVVEYLNQYEFLQANEMISEGRFYEFDSLVSESPLAVIIIDDIKIEEPLTLSIYPNLPNQPYHLIKSSNGQLMVMDVRRINALLRMPQDFGVK